MQGATKGRTLCTHLVLDSTGINVARRGEVESKVSLSGFPGKPHLRGGLASEDGTFSGMKGHIKSLAWYLPSFNNTGQYSEQD